jgi:hypothetical protein
MRLCVCVYLVGWAGTGTTRGDLRTLNAHERPRGGTVPASGVRACLREGIRVMARESSG